ncbi:hypothetical protein Pla123a_46750 [Posidoniimonas polymericola]|uniref:HlyD family secretion protein n=1 Tax=Posidoniimonas polymericola TaxID=2528002 RepID=A0A5C5XUP1_9BACT|nr:hypothetical protein [Posidoniimonas polymericola]TWT66281.1 hypothetical protein Pla123a_46750 [Posidoniimonas polymericola]
MRISPRSSAAAAILLLAAMQIGCDQGARQQGKSAELGPRSVYALGTLQPTSGVISITGTPGDKLKSFDPQVAENELTPADGRLGVLASYDARHAQLEALRTRRRLAEEKQQVDLLLAQAQLRGARAKVKQAEANQAEARLQSAQVKNLEEAAAIARDELESIEDLRESDPELVTEHQVRKQRNRVARAESEVQLAAQRIAPMSEAAEAALQAAQSSVEAAEVSVESLKKNGTLDAIDTEIAVAQQSLAQSVLWAPGADTSHAEGDAPTAAPDEPQPEPQRYTVLKIFTKPGEMVSQLPVIDLADVSEIECIAEVYEADAQEITLGQGATITSPAFSGQLSEGLRGEVQHISRMVGSPGLDARNPLAPKDRSIVEVRIAITTTDEAKLAEAAKRIGLQVTVRFDANESANEAKE